MSNVMGCFYKTVRLAKIITKKEICAKAKLSRQYLTKIEDSTEFFSISREMNDKLQKSLRIQFVNQQEILESFDKLKEEYLRAVIISQEKASEQYYFKIVEMKDKISNSIYYPQLLLLQFIHHVIEDPHNHELEPIHEILDKIVDHFDIRTLQVYDLYLGIYYLQKEQLVNAVELIKQAQSLSNDPWLQSMVCYYLGVLALKLGNSLEALRFTMKARELFDGTCNYKRSIQCLTHLSLVWMHLREYEGALRLSHEAIAASKAIEYRSILGENYKNMAWIALQMKEYQQVLVYANDALRHSLCDAMMCFHAAYASYKLNQIQQVLHWVANGLNIENEPKALSYRLLQDTKRLIRDPDSCEINLKHMIEQVKKRKYIDSDILRMLYGELAEYYKQQNRFELALKYYEFYLSL